MISVAGRLLLLFQQRGTLHTFRRLIRPPRRPSIAVTGRPGRPCRLCRLGIAAARGLRPSACCGRSAGQEELAARRRGRPEPPASAGHLAMCHDQCPVRPLFPGRPVSPGRPGSPCRDEDRAGRRSRRDARCGRPFGSRDFRAGSCGCRRRSRSRRNTRLGPDRGLTSRPAVSAPVSLPRRRGVLLPLPEGQRESLLLALPQRSSRAQASEGRGAPRRRRAPGQPRAPHRGPVRRPGRRPSRRPRRAAARPSPVHRRWPPTRRLPRRRPRPHGSAERDPALPPRRRGFSHPCSHHEPSCYPAGSVIVPWPTIAALPPTTTSVIWPASLRAVPSSTLGRPMATPWSMRRW